MGAEGLQGAGVTLRSLCPQHLSQPGFLVFPGRDPAQSSWTRAQDVCERHGQRWGFGAHGISPPLSHCTASLCRQSPFHSLRSFTLDRALFWRPWRCFSSETVPVCAASSSGEDVFSLWVPVWSAGAAQQHAGAGAWMPLGQGTGTKSLPGLGRVLEWVLSQPEGLAQGSLEHWGSHAPLQWAPQQSPENFVTGKS